MTRHTSPAFCKGCDQMHVEHTKFLLGGTARWDCFCVKEDWFLSGTGLQFACPSNRRTGTCRLKLFKFGIQLLLPFELSQWVSLNAEQEDDNSRGFAAFDSVFSIPSEPFDSNIHATRLAARVEQPAQLAVLLVRATRISSKKIFNEHFHEKYSQRREQRFILVFLC